MTFEDKHQTNQAIPTFAFVLDLNRIGESIPCIRKKLCHDGYFYQEEFIRELISCEEKWMHEFDFIKSNSSKK